VLDQKDGHPKEAVLLAVDGNVNMLYTLIIILLLLAVIAFLVLLYSEKIQDENKNYVPDSVEKKYWIFDAYVKRVVKATKYLYKVIIARDV